MKKKWKIILGAIVAISISAFVLLEASSGLEANLLEVQPQSIASVFKEEGSVVPEVEQLVYAAYSGRIKDLAVAEGDYVSEGQLLVTLDSREFDFKLMQLQAQLLSIQGERESVFEELEPTQAVVRSHELQIQKAQQSLEVAEANLERAEELFNAGISTKKEYDDAIAMVETAKINLELQEAALTQLFDTKSPAKGTDEIFAGRRKALQAQIEILQYQKSHHSIASPISGIVTDLSVERGGITNPQLPMLKIYQPDTYLIEVYVLTEDVPSIDKGMEVKLIQSRRGGDITSVGKVTKIASSAVETVSSLGLAEQRVKVTVEPVAPKKLDLFPGYKLDVEFTLDQRHDVLVVPKTALFPYKGGDALWVVSDELAQVQPVQTGFSNDRDVVITSGLNAGDQVILNPQLEGLNEGRKVQEMQR